MVRQHFLIVKGPQVPSRLPPRPVMTDPPNPTGFGLADGAAQPLEPPPPDPGQQDLGEGYRLGDPQQVMDRCTGGGGDRWQDGPWASGQGAVGRVN